MEEYLSEMTYVQVPAYRLVKKSAVSQNPEDEVIAEMMDWMKRNGLPVEKSRGIGYDIPVSKECQEKGYRGYTFCQSIPEDFMVQDEVEVIQFLGGHYAKLTIDNPMEDPFKKIPAGWNHLVEQLKERNLLNCSCEEGACFEECINTDRGQIMDIYIKVKEAF